MLINIVNGYINEGKLIETINNFETTHNQKAYLFMNQETFNELAIFCELNVDIELNKDSNYTVGYYCGRRVFQNEDLKFGEVDVR